MRALHHSRMRLLGYAFILLAASRLFAQNDGATIRTTVPIVVLPVTVTGSDGQFIYGLKPSDFLLFDNGKQREVRVDDPDSGAAPRLVILIQTSDLSNSALLKIRKTGAMVQGAVIGAKGEAAVLTFSDEIAVVQDFTSDADRIADVFSDLHRAGTGQGRMLDAVAQALDLLAKRPGAAASSILIIGENKDRGSKIKLDDLLRRMQRSPVTVDSLVYSAYLTAFTTKGSEYEPPDTGPWMLGAITETARLRKKSASALLTTGTGGQSLRFETQSKLENNLIHLGAVIHSRYIVSFTPEQPQPASFHSIQVKIKGQPQLVVRTRPGYWSDLQAQ